MLLNSCLQALFHQRCPQGSDPQNQKSHKQQFSSTTEPYRNSFVSNKGSLIFHFSQNFMQNLTPLSRPLYIEIEQGQPSPYLKELLSKVGSSEIEFLDFTLEGNGQEDLDNNQHNEQFQQQSKQSMSVIAQQSQQASNGQKTIKESKANANFQYIPQQYIPNMHLLDIDPALLTLEHFNKTLISINSATQEAQKQFIYLYLTDDDLQIYKDASLQTLIEAVHHNLSLFGITSRLQRKARVSRYLQKKKKRIWKKKINYDCRKKVADNRLRVKGKFVTRQQACLMLGIQLCSQQQLKQILKYNYNKMII